MTEQMASRLAEIRTDAAVERVSGLYGSTVYLTVRGYQANFRGAYGTKVMYDLETGKLTYRVGRGTIPSAMWDSIHDLETRRGAEKVL